MVVNREQENPLCAVTPGHVCEMARLLLAGNAIQYDTLRAGRSQRAAYHRKLAERPNGPPSLPTPLPPYPSLHPPHRKQKTIAPTDRFYRPRLRARNGTGRNGTERNGTERKGTNCRECAGGIFQALRIGASSATRSGILESFSSSGRSPRLYSGKLRHSRTFNHARRAFRLTRSRSLDRPQPCRSLIAINLWRGFPKHLDSTATRNAAL